VNSARNVADIQAREMALRDTTVIGKIPDRRMRIP
jgi:chromosome condensin MukBEF complex kleisin-like MukF subunit